ncbi:predicted protein [Streptomyces albidoflavus]|nr:predicted protein [Streptomyces albidoflavus]
MRDVRITGQKLASMGAVLNSRTDGMPAEVNDVPPVCQHGPGDGRPSCGT